MAPLENFLLSRNAFKDQSCQVSFVEITDCGMLEAQNYQLNSNLYKMAEDHEKENDQGWPNLLNQGFLPLTNKYGMKRSSFPGPRGVNSILIFSKNPLF